MGYKDPKERPDMRTSKPITVTLGPQLASLEARLKSGEYASASEVMRSALRALDRQDVAPDDPGRNRDDRLCGPELRGRFARMTAALPRTLEGDFDYIVVGAGTAGCIVANRLSADPGKRVLILEAGGKDNWIWFHIPVGYLFAIGNPRSDWMFRTEPEAGLNGRSLAYPRGKVIGGSSAINAMISMRGQAADYDHWRQLGLAGWGYDDVLPAVRRLVDHFLGESEHHCTGGG